MHISNISGSMYLYKGDVLSIREIILSTELWIATNSGESSGTRLNNYTNILHELKQNLTLR